MAQVVAPEGDGLVAWANGEAHSSAIEPQKPFAWTSQAQIDELRKGRIAAMYPNDVLTPIPLYAAPVPEDRRKSEMALCLRKAIEYLEQAHERHQGGVDMRAAWDQCLDADLPRFRRAL